MNAHSAASQMVSFLLDWAVRAAFLAAVAGLVAAIVRIRDVRTRLALWSALLFGSLALPAVRPFMPPVLTPLLSPMSPPAVVTRAFVAAPAVLRHASPPVRARATTPPPGIAGAPRSYLAETAAGLWAAGTLLLLARLFTGLILARRVIRASAVVEDRIGRMRGLRVLESARVTVPLTAGVFRPVVVLPEDWRQWESERLRAVLAHERSHVERRDALIRVAAQLHRALLWFSPVAWWLERHLADLAECASDDSALAETVDRSAYAAIVLDFFRVGRKRLSIEGLAMAQGGSAERRIDRILAGGPLCARLRRSTLIAVLALTAGSVALVAALQNQPGAAVPPAASAVSPPPPTAKPAPAAKPEAAPRPARAPRPGEPGSAWFIFHGGAARGSGGTDDIREAQSVYDRAKRDMIWIRRGGRAWVISDAGLLGSARDLFLTADGLSDKQEALAKQQEEFAHHQQAMAEAMEKLRGNMPRIEADLKKLEEQVRVQAPTADQLSKLQERLSQMQSRLAEAQAAMSGHQDEMARKMAEFALRQEDLGRLQDQFGKEQEKAAEQAGHMLERLLDEAIRSGLARPCDPTY
ncbi:MAG: M56 family metallopeptidase [Bryobacteraceae bacterium]